MVEKVSFGIIEVVKSYIFFKESQQEEKQNGLTLKKIRRELIAQMIPEPESEEARSRSRAGNDIFNNERLRTFNWIEIQLTMSREPNITHTQAKSEKIS